MLLKCGQFTAAFHVTGILNLPLQQFVSQGFHLGNVTFYGRVLKSACKCKIAEEI
jgi:hypothetical protein